MSNPRTAALLIDVQLDYLDGGAAEEPGADALIEPLVELAKGADLVIASRDWYPANHRLFTAGVLSKHCVQKTKGARVHPKIAKVASLTVSKNTDRTSNSFSAFDGGTLRPARTLEAILKTEKIERVLVGGIALDTAVRWTALDANALGYETLVPLDCIVVYDDEQRRQTLAAFQRAGVRTVNHWSWE